MGVISYATGNMSETLNNILSVKRQEVASAKQAVFLSSLREEIKHLPRCRDFYRSVSIKTGSAINIIAEIKKASPSAGLIRNDFDVVALAKIYQQLGAQALSVLTDEQFFQGHLSFLGEVKDVVALPILRKDFIIDEYQIYQSRAAGADAILLIVEALTPQEVDTMIALARSLTLTVLVEVHEQASLDGVIDILNKQHQALGGVLLGINNRNLKTMVVDIKHSEMMKATLSTDLPVISESGIKTRADVSRLIDAGFSGVLIGETLMKQDDIASAFKSLFTAVP
jgi:indole-3-glycerol phosphate synthase